MTDASALARTALIPFKEDQIPSVMTDGRPHVALKPIIEAIGLDYSTQRAKLQGRSWAVVGQSPMTGADGKTYNMVTVDVRTLLMLLATVDESRVADHVRPKLVAYQGEVADAIEGYWTRGGVVNPRAGEPQLAELAEEVEARRQHLAAIRIAERAAAQARVLTAIAPMVDPQWVATQAKERYGVAIGRESEIPFSERTLAVHDFLGEKGISASKRRAMAGNFGKKMKKLYIDLHGVEPGKCLRFVEGAQREVGAYREEHRPLMEQVWREMGNV